MSPPAPPSPPPMSVVSSHRHHGIQRHHSNSFSSSKSSSSSSSSALNSRKLMPRSRSSPIMDSSFTSNSLSSSSSFTSDIVDDDLPHLVHRNWTSHAAAASPFNFIFNPLSAVASVFRSFLPAFQSLLVPTCHWLSVVAQNKSPHRSNSSSRKRLLTGTFFGQKKGRVSFAVQETPRSDPILLLELATPTCHLVKEMASGMVRILLECDRTNSTTTAAAGAAGSMKKKALWDEPVWTMFCNGHKLGYATSRACTPSDFHVLSTVQSVSVGAGVMPAAAATTTLQLPAPACPTPKDDNTVVKESAAKIHHGASGEIMYMRAKFDRVIGSRDSEAFYMINLDCISGGAGNKFNNGGPELSIFLLRI